MGFKAILKKQLKVFIKNPGVFVQFIIYPAIAWMILFFMDFDAMTGGMEYIEGITYEFLETFRQNMAANTPNMVTMQATIFAGMALIPVMAGFIAEDIEKKSLRFLTMAGVKPAAYLFGIGIVVAFFALLSSVAFSFISEFNGVDFWVFVGAMMSGVLGSIMLGATIGILTKNQQNATALSMPIAMVVGMGPLIAQFNGTVANALRFVYTQQLNIVADSLNGIITETPLWQSFAIMWANVAVFGAVFIVVYKKKGIKE
ncbi:MAG: ABC transporter permease [Defluviitaleaceae bacterium]|nr:ABC transporter permease [Defluviitaleaceae bacterium]